MVVVETVTAEDKTGTLKGRVEGRPFGFFHMTSAEGQTMAVLRIPEENKVYHIAYSNAGSYQLFEFNIDEFEQYESLPPLIPELHQSSVSEEPESLEPQHAADPPVIILNPADPATIDVLVTVSANPEEGGNLKGSGLYEQDEAVIISATTNPGFIFLNRTEDGQIVSINPEYTFNVEADRSLVTNFKEGSTEIFVMNLFTSSAEGGTATDPTDDSPYIAGTILEIKAEPDPDYTFSQWSAPAGNCGNVNIAVTTFTMPEQDVTVKANFILLGSPEHPEKLLLSAGSTVLGDKIDFSWEASEGADRYFLSLVRASDGTVFFSQNVSNVTKCKVTGFPGKGTAYRWRVVAEKASV